MPDRSTRRGVLGQFLCWSAFGATGLVPRPGRGEPKLAAAYPGILKFAVARDGAPLGVVMQRFGRNGADAITEVFIDFDVTFAGIALFRYEHRARERWRGGRLIALDSMTNDDGDRQAVMARATPDGLRVDGPSGRLMAPADILPSSYWHPRFVEQTRMLDSQRGRLLRFTIGAAGRETITALERAVECTRYALRGDVDLDAWYDDRRVWQKMAFTIAGNFIEYSRVAPDSSDAAAFGLPLRDGRRLPDG